ncbi:WD40 repeat-like protein, partial [Gonapodya prolifera JEL478]
GHTDRVWHCAWSPSGKELATCSGDKTVRIWAPASPKAFQAIPNPPSTAPDVESDEKPKDFSNFWTCTALLDGSHKRTVRRVAWAPDGSRIASCSFDATVSIWERPDTYGLDTAALGDDGGRDEWPCVAVLEGHENEVKGVTWGDGLIATCGRDKSVWIWETDPTSDDFACLSVLQEHSQDVKSVHFSPSSHLLASCSYDDTVRLWFENPGTDEWELADVLLPEGGTVWELDWNADGTGLVASCDDGGVRVWRAPEGSNGSAKGLKARWKEAARIQKAHTRSVYSVSWSKAEGNGALATGAGDNAIKVFTPSSSSTSPEPQFTPSVHLPSPHGGLDVNTVAWNDAGGKSPDQDKDGIRFLLATGGDDGVVRIWRYVV